MSKSLLALEFCVLIFVSSANAQGHLPAHVEAPVGAFHSDMVVAPACPVGHTEQFTKELQIDYFPSRERAAIPNPQSLTLRLVFNGPSWRDNDRTVAFQRKEDGRWSASVPLRSQWEYAIWYVRDDQSGRRDDNHGQYWDVVFCDANGKKLIDGIRDQAAADAGTILDDDVKRIPDYDKAVADIEGSGASTQGVLLFDEWLYKLRRQNHQNSAGQDLISEIDSELTRHAEDSHYLRWTATFLIGWRTYFPAALVERAVEMSDRHPEPGMSSVRSELEREQAEGIEDPREQAKALGVWLAKYPNDRFYGDEVRTERLDLFDRVGDIPSAEAVFLDLKLRFPDEAALNVAMASIYIRHKIKLEQALRLLDKADRQREAHSTLFLPLGILNGDPKQDRATLNLWRARVLLQEKQWAKAEHFLQDAVPVLDESEPYALMGRVQQQRHELEKAKNSYLEASVRTSEHEQDYVDEFVRLSLKTGTPSREAAMQEIMAARKRTFDAAHYTPALVDLPSPNFAFTSTSGEKVTAASLRGQTVVLDIWSTWCGPCVSELGGFERLRQAHPDLRVLLVATRSKLPEIEKVFREQGVSTKEIILDDDQNSANFGSNGVPQTYVIDKNGHIRIVHYGALPDVVSYLESDLASIRNAASN